MLAGPNGHPYHPMLVTVPIGAWVLSLGFDIASHLISRPGFLVRGSEWLIAAGLIAAVVASTTGFIDLIAIPVGTAPFRTACTHMCINLTLIMCYAVDFALRYHAKAGGQPVGAGPLVLSLACVAALLVSGYLGGKLTYRYGVRVAAEGEQDRVGGYLPSRRG